MLACALQSKVYQAFSHAQDASSKADTGNAKPKRKLGATRHQLEMQEEIVRRTYASISEQGFVRQRLVDRGLCPCSPSWTWAWSQSGVQGARRACTALKRRACNCGRAPTGGAEALVVGVPEDMLMAEGKCYENRLRGEVKTIASLALVLICPISCRTASVSVWLLAG